VTVETRHFTVKSNLDDATLKVYSDSLEAYYKNFVEHWGITLSPGDKKGKPRIFLYRTVYDYMRDTGMPPFVLGYFRPFELDLQIPEGLRRLEVGIALDDDQQPRQRRRQLILRVAELIDGGGIVRRGVALHLPDLRARLGDGRERILFELRRALDGLDQVGHQVGAPLVDVLDLGPLRLYRLIQGDELVVAAHPPETHDSGQDEETEQDF